MSDEEWQPSEDSSEPTGSQSDQGEVSRDPTTSTSGANADRSSIRAKSDEEWQPSEDSSEPTGSQSDQGEVSRDPTTSTSGANADRSSIRLPSISPLPELIVEREMDRHDEPEEFYRWLLRRVRLRYLRWLQRAGDVPCCSLESTWDADGGSSGEIFRNSGRGDEQGCELEIVSQPASTDGDGETGGARYNDVSQFGQAHLQQGLENKENYKKIARHLRRGTYSSPSLTSPIMSSIRSENVYSEDSGASCKAKTHQVEKIHLLELRSTEHFKSLSLVSEKPSLVQTLMENINVERVRCAKFSRPPVIVAYQSPYEDAEKSNKNVSSQSDRNSSSNKQSGSSDTHLSYSSEPHSFDEISSPSSHEPSSHEPSSHEPSSHEPSSHEPSSHETPQQPLGYKILSTITEEVTSDLSGKTSQSKRKAHVSDIGDLECSKRLKNDDITMTTKKHISENVMEDEIISSSNTFGHLCEEIPDDISRPLCESTPQYIIVEKVTVEKPCYIEPEIMREATQRQISNSPIMVRKSSESSISPIVAMTSQKQKFFLRENIHLSKNAEVDVTEGAYMVERMESDVDDVESEHCVRSDEKYYHKKLQTSLQSTTESELEAAVGERHQKHHNKVERMELDVDEVESKLCVRSNEKYYDKKLQTSLQSTTESELEAAVGERHHMAVQINLIEDIEEETPLTLKEMSTQTRHSKGDQSFILRSTDMNKQYKKTKATQVNTRTGVKTLPQKSGGIDKGVQFNLRVDSSTQVNFGKNKIVQVNFGIDKAVNTDFGINKCVQVCIGIDKCEQVSM